MNLTVSDFQVKPTYFVKNTVVDIPHTYSLMNKEDIHGWWLHVWSLQNLGNLCKSSVICFIRWLTSIKYKNHVIKCICQRTTLESSFQGFIGTLLSSVQKYCLCWIRYSLWRPLRASSWYNNPMLDWCCRSCLSFMWILDHQATYSSRCFPTQMKDRIKGDSSISIAFTDWLRLVLAMTMSSFVRVLFQLSKCE